jgi:translation initiation factor IF-2
VGEHEADSQLLNRVEKAVGDKAYDRGGKTKTPNRKTTRFEDKKNDRRKGRPGYKDRNQKNFQKPPIPVVIKNITLDGPTSVQDFAHLLNKKAAEVIKKLLNFGVMATINQELDIETLTLLGEEFGTTVEIRVSNEEILSAADVPDDPQTLVERPAVVTIMGHVDHGKTSLLDASRHANVQASEAGGLTQHIGAYQAEINGKKITFLDTPGHEAFTAMRARGAQMTDIAILVVAADDGIMPQTVEAINHAQAAGVPIIVAVNKIDKEGANPDRIKQELTEYGLVCEEWGGETIVAEVSAKTKRGLDELLEMILLVAEVGDLKANPHRKAKGSVIEAKLDKGRGPVATVLVQNGTLEIGDYVILGSAQGRVRAMTDEWGRSLKKALPSTPAEIIGLSEVPQAGDVFQVVEDERLARQIASERTAVKREEAIHSRSRVSLDDLFIQIQKGEVKDLNLIVKADVQGSIEALKQSLEKLSNDEVRVNIIHQAVGAVTEADVMLASASNAIILGFNVRPDVNARKTAESQQVDIRLYRVIYNAIEDVKAALAGLLKPEIRESSLGHAEVRAVIKVPKVGSVAGCYVLEGKIIRNSQCRIIRDGIVVHEGDIASLKRFKDDVKEVASGFECGISIEHFNDIHEGDQIESFVLEEIKRELEEKSL